MRLTDDVQIPETLAAAVSSGQLALFVGAGVSINPPSNLPLFTGLARQLGVLAGTLYDSVEQPDAFLGRLHDLDSNVKQRARDIIADPRSRPNPTHAAIARFAVAAPSVRIVTTNYDEHLSTVAAENGWVLGDRYNGPAVPLGRDFTGIVYLHGAVSRPARELILTDEDFGRAYLTDGWARRFVQDLFMSRTVLFIGYSHNDVVMKYLARGLPPSTNRFVFTDQPADPKWNDLRITPVAYPAGNDHAALAEALDLWTDRLTMGHLDHRARVREIVAGGPPKTPVDADYLASALTTPAGVRAFAETASGEDWLQWAEGQLVFGAMFEPASVVPDATGVLVNWLEARFLEDEKSADLALGLLARRGPVVCAALMRAIARSAYSLRETSPQLARRWLIVVSAALRTATSDPEETWHILYRSGIDAVSMLPLFRRALRPRLVLAESKPWYLSEEEKDTPARVNGEIAWSSSESELNQMWEVIRPRLSELADSVLQILEQSIRDAYEVLALFEHGRRWDSWSFRRSAIEEHEQDSLRDFTSTIIDGLRDASAQLAKSDPTLIPRWLKDEHELFQRLAIHLLTESDAVAPADKLARLLDGAHLHDHHLKHEVFRLLAAIAPSLARNDRALLLAQVLQGPPAFNTEDSALGERLHQRSIFDILEWLSRYTTRWPQLRAELKKIKKAHPDMGVRPHSDFGSWMSSGQWGGNLPLEVGQFSTLIDSGADEAVAALLGRDYSERDFEEPTWDDACSLVRQTVEQRPELGFPLIESRKLQRAERRDDLIASIIRGWSSATLDDVLAEQVAVVVDRFTEPQLVDPISEFVAATVDHRYEARPETLLQCLDGLATRLWTHNASDFDSSWDDWLMAGLNTWPGHLSQYWLNRIRLRWRSQRDEWSGLSETEKSALTSLLDDATRASDPALAILARDVYFLYAADETFTRTKLFPEFSVAAGRAVHAWASYLYNPRLSVDFLAGGFWALILDARKILDGIEEDRLGSQYWNVVARVAVQSPPRVVDYSQLLEALGEKPDGVCMTSFVGALSDAIDDLDRSDLDRTWDAWLKDAIARRVTDRLTTLSTGERAAWADLALETKHLIPEVISLLGVEPGRLTERTTFDHVPEGVLREHGDEVIDFVRRRVNATPKADWRIVYELNEFVAKLKTAGVRSDKLRQLAESALNIGIHDAARWID